MKHLSTLILLIGVIVGLAIQQPAKAFAAPMETAAMTGSIMASMPACAAGMRRDASHTPRKCGIADCIAMMASSTPLMLGDGSAMIMIPALSEHDERIGTSLALRGRSTVPEPEPPTA